MIAYFDKIKVEILDKYWSHWSFLFDAIRVELVSGLQDIFTRNSDNITFTRL